MEKIIKVNGKEMKFKVSAATNILYKRAFKEDILIKLSSYTKNMKELQAIKTKVDQLKADETKNKEEVASKMAELVSSDVFEEVSSFSSETLPKLAYIMFLEANEKASIFGKLNEESYFTWLMDIDNNDLISITSEVMDLWQGGAKNTSRPKN